MALDVDAWMDDLTEKLRREFAGRLLFVGVQGSRRRNEASDNSDIDAVVVLDTLDADDLRRYRGILQTMAQADLACGFVGDAAALANWPRHELFQFRRDTRDIHGNLDDLLPAISRDDVAAGVRIGASGIYHLAGHLCVHGGDDAAEALLGAYKGAFFVLLAVHFLETGHYAGTRRELLALLSGANRTILDTLVRWDELKSERDASPDRFFSRILEWSGNLLAYCG
jgi:hypothetical protein